MKNLFKNKKKPKSQNQKGVIALITVLIVVAVSLSIGISINLLSINEAKMSLQKNQSSKSYYLSNLCAEQALMKLKENSNYSGNETINTEEGECTILPIEGSWTIKLSATSSNQARKMKIVVGKINPKMIINTWQEVGDF